MGALNPQILTWARETAGLSPEEAAHAIQLKDAHGQSATDRLAALESGQGEPSHSLLLRMAKAYRRSLLVFYLSEPPRTGDRGQDFRTLPGVATKFDPDLDALIRDIKGRQSVVRSLVEDTEPEPLSFVGSVSSELAPGSLAERMQAHLQWNRTEFRNQRSLDHAFGYLRTKVEATGVFVLLLGNLGSHHTDIAPETFRGFAIADPIAPFTVVNDHDAKSAWSFTLLHEVAHLWLGATGISSANYGLQIERYCSDVAAEVLVPSAELGELQHLQSASEEATVEAVSGFAQLRKVSRAMIAYRLFRVGTIGQHRWESLAARFRQEWTESAAREAEGRRKQDGGPNYYVVKHRRLGDALVGLVRRSVTEGALTYTKAGQILGMKPRNVAQLLNVTTEGR